MTECGDAEPGYPSQRQEEYSKHGSTGISARNAGGSSETVFVEGQRRLPARLGSCFDALRRKRDSDDAQQCGQQR